MDLIDKKLLYNLDFNIRKPLSFFAKRLRTSKVVVNYRLKRLEKEGIIQKYYTVINLRKLKILNAKIFVILRNTSRTELERIINYLKQKEYILWIAEVDGLYNIIISITGSSVNSLYTYFNEIKIKFGQYFQKYDITFVTKAPHFKFNFFLDKLKFKNEQFEIPEIREEDNEIKLDKLDKQILFILSKSAKIKLLEIAKKTNVSSDTIRNRIKKLKKKNIIVTYRPLLNFNKMGYIHYKILFKLKKYDINDEKRIKSYILKKNEFIYLIQSFGPWDLELDLVVKNPHEKLELIDELKQLFKDNIETHTSLEILKQNKIDFYSRII